MENMKWNAARSKRKLDRIFSKIVLGKYKRVCQWCGKSDCKIDCSHIIPREILITRWNLDNAVALCFGCHKRRGTSWHGSPLVAGRWIEQKLGKEHCDNLIKISLEPYVFDEAEARKIEERLKTYEQRNIGT
jgi:hypothetical protein